MAVVDARVAVATRLSPVTVAVLAGTEALTVNVVVVRAVMEAPVTEYGAGAATETLSPTAKELVPEFVNVILVPTRLTITAPEKLTEAFALTDGVTLIAKVYVLFAVETAVMF